MRFRTLLFLIAFAELTTCCGQAPSNNLNIGDTVTELSKSIWIVFQAANGDYWFGSDTDGVYCYDTKTIIHYSAKDGLSSNRIRSIQEDRQGNIYFSTLGGIDKFDGVTFTRLTAIPSKSPKDNWKLQADDIWFSTLGKNGENGPLRYDGEKLYQLQFPKHFMEEAYYEGSPNSSWSPYDVYYIYKDSKGSMWFGTSNFGICRYDGQSFSWLYEDHLTNTPEGGSFGIRSILEDAKGKYWFCNSRYHYDISTEIISKNGKVLIDYEREIGIEDIKTADGKDHIYFMSAIKDSRGDMWMATYDQGVWRYDGEKTTHYPLAEKDKAVTLFSIYKDHQDAIWLATHENGIYKFNGETFEKFIP